MIGPLANMIGHPIVSNGKEKCEGIKNANERLSMKYDRLIIRNDRSPARYERLKEDTIG
ncbi:hypothetical protein [Sporosarcina sp. Te-1]|uniref:hypothetical protein n=1 Tax=Sporosarcina sp. Te-1 TaxID=2818390 RepID=UPI001A9DDC3B|nr:hypothetical protein [Sporosarcina sp. Te-1]QTD40542.1 hypothetical protein J3U78_17495 [Sporosarcina sp. Te-1]